MFFDCLAVAGFGQEFFVLQRCLARIDNDIGLKVENFLDLLERHVEQGADTARQAFEKPNMHYRSRQLDMAHALAPHFGLDDLDAAFLADHAAMAHPFVFAAIAFVIFGRAKNLRAKQAVTFRLEGAIVNGLRFLDLAVRPRADLVGRGDRDFDCVEA